MTDALGGEERRGEARGREGGAAADGRAERGGSQRAVSGLPSVGRPSTSTSTSTSTTVPRCTRPTNEARRFRLSFSWIPRFRGNGRNTRVSSRCFLVVVLVVKLVVSVLVGGELPRRLVAFPAVVP